MKRGLFSLGAAATLLFLSFAALAQDTSLHMAAAANDTERAKTLLDAGADPNAVMTGGVTPLMVAAKFNAIDAMGMLLDYRARIDQTNASGNTALMMAVTAKRLDAVRFLVRRGANVLLKNDDGMGAVDIARAIRANNIAQLLENAVNRGAVRVSGGREG